MAWFGPQVCNCSCISPPPPPPPPPPCHCQDLPCYAEGAQGFSSIRVVVDIDDSFVVNSRQIAFRCQFGDCGRRWIVTNTQWGISGLSAFNGTYDIPYMRGTEGSGDWEPTTLEEELCGSWHFPRLQSNLRLWQIRTLSTLGLYYYDECATSTTFFDELVPHEFNVKSGKIFPVATPGNIHPGTPSPTFSGFIGGFPSGSSTLTTSYFDCDVPSIETEVNNYTWDVNVTSGFPTLFSNPLWNLFDQNATLGPVGNDIEVDGQKVTSVNHAFSPPSTQSCKMGSRERLIQIHAYDVERELPMYCSGVVVPGGSRKERVYWNEFNARMAASLNV